MKNWILPLIFISAAFISGILFNKYQHDGYLERGFYEGMVSSQGASAAYLASAKDLNMLNKHALNSICRAKEELESFIINPPNKKAIAVYQMKDDLKTINSFLGHQNEDVCEIRK
ncbi:hypothetical protein FE810_13810 [Thalassotalea litorea]|uniref:Uncharacterized protein n=1 Tax=Thalassotalea litorea TaxID=2020715 RepID=A0A5R9IKR3_9GAMM|nr:hypothetical protein [Thalassotalea litorea]TLU61887.1 hypothetical protein FE810_13810 [Thalassotalea litorea]